MSLFTDAQPVSWPSTIERDPRFITFDAANSQNDTFMDAVERVSLALFEYGDAPAFAGWHEYKDGLTLSVTLDCLLAAAWMKRCNSWC